MNKLWQGLKEFAIFAAIGVGTVWTFNWSTHTIVWLIGVFLFVIMIAVGQLANIMSDSLKKAGVL